MRLGNTYGRQDPAKGSIRKKPVITNSRDAGTLSNYIPQLPQSLSQAYKAFNATLTPSQRRTLNIHSDANPTGEIKPLHKEDECVRVDDMEERPSPFPAPLDALEPSQADQPHPSGYLHIIAVLAILRRVLRVYEVSGQQEPSVRLHGECIALALGIPGFKQSDVARTYGVTKQAINKRVRVIAAALELPPAYRTPLAALPRPSGFTLKGNTHPHPSKPRHKPARGQQCPNQPKHPTPSPKRGAATPGK